MHLECFVACTFAVWYTLEVVMRSPLTRSQWVSSKLDKIPTYVQFESISHHLQELVCKYQVLFIESDHSRFKFWQLFIRIGLYNYDNSYMKVKRGERERSKSHAA